MSYLRISPRKVRLVANLIKGLPVEEAEGQLNFLAKRAARPILKLLRSALANAQNNDKLSKENLYVDKLIVDEGPMLKRWQPRAMGRATPIRKKTCHITLVLGQKESLAVPEKREDRPAKVKESRLSRTPEDKEKKKKPELLEEIGRLEEKEEPMIKPEPVPPARPYPTTSQSKKKFFSRQTFGNVKKYFRRKSF